MVHRWHEPMVLALSSVCIALSLASSADAGLADKLKKKLGEKAGQKADAVVDKAADATAAANPGEGTDQGSAAEGSSTENAAGTAASGTKVSSVSTKFDYVPGDKVLFADDFTQDELGEFPLRWRLVGGAFEVAEMDGERWLRCVSADGRVRMKLPPMASLPEFWTLEFDFHATEPMGSALTVLGLGKGDSQSWEAVFPHGDALAFRSGEFFSATPLEGGTVPGRHHVMLMARGPALKVYIDRQRMASVPDVSGAAGMPEQIEFRLWASTKPMITGVRFAEGCRPAKDLLAEGKLVTYGIHFATGSDVVEPESAPILRQIAAYLEANPSVKLAIVGHTDHTGTAAGNLDLSRRRAASVARVLYDEFTCAADRFTTDGKGDTEAIASNADAEGRAMNRRVEFKKM